MKEGKQRGSEVYILLLIGNTNGGAQLAECQKHGILPKLMPVEEEKGGVRKRGSATRRSLLVKTRKNRLEKWTSCMEKGKTAVPEIKRAKKNGRREEKKDREGGFRERKKKKEYTKGRKL